MKKAIGNKFFDFIRLRMKLPRGHFERATLTFPGGKRMKIKKIDIPAAGTWARDCELLHLSYYRGFVMFYHKNEDDTYWRMKCSGIISYKFISKEFSTTGYLLDLPIEGAFFEIIDSPWIQEFGNDRTEILNKCKHYILKFYDETVEIIAREFVFEQIKEAPVFDEIV